MTRILVVEDSPDLALGLRNNLEIEGYEVEVATDGRQGLELARARIHPPGPENPGRLRRVLPKY